jgi:serine/threonine protein kinase
MARPEGRCRSIECVGTLTPCPHSTRIYEKIGDPIGKGTYGEVFKGIDKVIKTRKFDRGLGDTDDTGDGSEFVALKKILVKENDEFPITSAREIKLLQSIEHPNIIRLREVVSSGLCILLLTLL